MKAEPRGSERAVLAAMARTVLRTGTVAWAGARASSRGSSLHRDGAVARLAVRGDGVQAQVYEGELPETVTLGVEADQLRATCTCEQAPCAHAVAALLELQRKVRQVQQAGEQQTAIMSALRDRLGASRPAEAPKQAKVLSNLERLPLEAGVDMVALAWRQSLRHGPIEVAELTALVDRLQAQAASRPAQTRELALRLLLALSAKKVVFVPLPEAAEAAVLRLVPLVVGAGSDGKALPAPGQGGSHPLLEQLGTLTELALDGHPQVAAHAGAGLEAAAVRDAGVCAQLTTRALAALPALGGEWREVAVPTGRDRLLSGLCAAWLHHGDVDQALQVALAWPPTRGALQALAAELGRRGRTDDAVRLAGFYDPRGDLWPAAVQAGAEAALQSGQLATAARLAAWAFEHRPAEAWFSLLARIDRGPGWPERRAALVARVLSEDDPPWLVERLATEPDAGPALLQAIQAAPLRERTVRAALAWLREAAPLLALHGRCVRLLALAAAPGTTARACKDELVELEKVAADVGEPGLFVDFARLLGRELGDKAAVATAVAAAVGRERLR